MPLLRDRLLARLEEMGEAPDHQRLAAEVLGIRGASPQLARKLVAQALVLEDRRDEWRRIGERLLPHAPAAPAGHLLDGPPHAPPHVRQAAQTPRPPPPPFPAPPP